MDTTQVWNASNPWATPDSSALATGLSYVANKTPAVADPMATPTTSNPASAARALGTAVQDASAVPTGGVVSQMPMQNKLSVSQGTPLTQTAVTTAQVNAPNQAASPPATVAAPSANGGGWYNYYNWNAQTGSYVYAGQYNSGSRQGVGTGLNPDGSPMGYTPPPNAVMSGTPIVKQNGDKSNGATQINQQNSQAIGVYQSGQATANANAAAATQTSQVNDTVAYMAAHNGQTPANTVLPASVIEAAQTAYAAQVAANGPAFSVAGAQGIAPINTDTADMAGLAAKNAIASQYNTNLGGADAGTLARSGAFAQAAQSGANQITHDTAAAASFNENLAAFGNALSNQATLDENATGQKLDNDIQAVQDVATTLQQQISQLDNATQLRVKGALDQLNQQIAYYRQAVQQYGADSAFVMNLAKGALAAGAAVAAIAVPGAGAAALAGAAVAASK